MAKLVITGGVGKGAEYTLGQNTVIGRHPKNELVLVDPHAGRTHARIEKTPQGFVIHDLKSANGTFVNGQRVQERLLRDGDEVCIAATFFRFQEPPAAAAPPAERQVVPVGGKVGTAPPPVAVDEAPRSLVTFAEAADAQAETVDAALDASSVISQMDLAPADPAELKKVTARLTTLVELSKTLGQTLELQKLYEQIMERLFTIFPQASRGCLLVAEKGLAADIKDMTPAVVRNRGLQPGQAGEMRLSTNVVRRTLQNKASLLFSDTSSSDLIGAASIANLQIRSAMCVPMLLENEVLGVVYIDTSSRQKRFNAEDLSLLTAVASQVAVAVKNAHLAQQYAREQQLRNNMSRFFAPNVVQGLIDGTLAIDLGGHKKTGTIFFSDIVGFSALSRMMSAEEVVSVLNRYFTIMQDIIFRFGGSVDKTGGDAIMAHWNLIGESADAHASAVAAALEMQNAMVLFNEAHRRALPSPIGMGIGLNTGECVAGNIGSEQKIEFTVIGENVNMAQRFESLAGRGQVFVTEGTYREIKDRAVAIRMPDCRIKGWDAPVAVFSIRGVLIYDAGGDSCPILSLPLEIAGPAVGAAFPAVITRGYSTEGGVEFQVLSSRKLRPGEKLRAQLQLPERFFAPLSLSVLEQQAIPHDILGTYYTSVLRCTELGDKLAETLTVGSLAPADITAEQMKRE